MKGCFIYFFNRETLRVKHTEKETKMKKKILTEVTTTKKKASISFFFSRRTPLPGFLFKLQKPARFVAKMQSFGYRRSQLVLGLVLLSYGLGFAVLRHT